MQQTALGPAPVANLDSGQLGRVAQDPLKTSNTLNRPGDHHSMRIVVFEDHPGHHYSPMATDAIADTDRVILRPWRLNEADRFFDMHRRTEVARWLGGQPMVDLAEAVAMLEQMSARREADQRFGSWAIVERATGQPAGSVLLKPIPDGAGQVEIGWHLHPDSWGRGLATEAGSALLRYGFELGLTEIWALTHLDNARSARVCGRLGLRLLGVTRRWYPEPSLMFWVGTTSDQQPSLRPDREASAT